MQTLGKIALATGKHIDSDEVQARLDSAAAAVFSANATREDVEIVLVEMAIFSGFYEPTVPGFPADKLQNWEGRRSVFAWLAARLDVRTKGELHTAALVESSARRPRLAKEEQS